MNQNNMTTFAMSSDEPDPVEGQQVRTAQAPRATSSGGVINRMNVVLVVMFAVGLGCVYLLSLREPPEAASGEQQKNEMRVDAALSALATGTNGSTSRAKDVVNTFYYQARERQIPVDELHGNPFVFSVTAPDVPQIVTENKTQPKEAPPQEDALDRAMDEVRRLKLQSVLSGGSGATAMISNNLLTLGQSIRGWKVQKIEPEQVTLQWRDKTYILRMPR